MADFSDFLMADFSDFRMADIADFLERIMHDYTYLTGLVVCCRA